MNKILQKLLVQDGLSLVQGLIIGAVISSGALVFTTQLQDQKKVQKRAQEKGEIELLHDTLYGTLQNRDHCTRTFQETLSNGGQLGKNLQAIKAVDGNLLFTINPEGRTDPSLTYMNGHVAIKGMDLKNIGPDGVADLEIDYLLLGKSPNLDTSKKVIRRQIQIKIQKKPDDMSFNGCYAIKNYNEGDSGAEKYGNSHSMKDFCLSLGSLVSWNEDAQVCALRRNICSDAQKLFVGIDSNGEAICKSIFDHTNFSEFVDSSGSICNPPSASNVRFIQVGDRVRIDCGSSPYSPNIVTHRYIDGSCQPVSGGWSSITWSECTSGPNPTRTGTRTCTNPAPSCNGAPCSGPYVIQEKCSCTPSITCEQKRAQTCEGESAGVDDCDNDCGEGILLDCGSEPPICPQSECEEKVSKTCSGEDAGRDSCGKLCGVGTKECPVSCKPNRSCEDIKKDFYTFEKATNDSCGKDCGYGTKPNPVQDCAKYNQGGCSPGYQECNSLGSVNVRMDVQSPDPNCMCFEEKIFCSRDCSVEGGRNNLSPQIKTVCTNR